MNDITMLCDLPLKNSLERYPEGWTDVKMEYGEALTEWADSGLGGIPETNLIELMLDLNEEFKSRGHAFNCGHCLKNPKYQVTL